MKAPRLPRRTVLRGMGLGSIAVGLPPLEAMLTGNGELPRAHAQAAAPVYFLTFFYPCGVVGANMWPPEMGGPNYTITRILKPLEPHKADFLLLHGLRKEEYLVNSNINNDVHSRGHASFATGVGIQRGGAGGASVDQILAARFGKETRFPSLPVALGSTKETGAISFISWTAREKPVPPERNPAQFFSKVFSASSTDPVVLSDRRSILDYLKGDVESLQKKVSGADVRRVSEHLDSIRELERQLTFVSNGAACDPGQPPPLTAPAPVVDDGQGAYGNDRAKILIDLQVMAFKCDLTRFGSYMLANRSNKRQFPWLNIRDPLDGHHGISHDSSTEGYEKQTKICIDELEVFAYLLQKMKDVKIGDKTLLDQSLVFCANEHGSGASHNPENIPVIIAGRAGGKLNPGRFIRYPKGTPYSNVFVNLMSIMGHNVTRFGPYSTGPLNLDT